MLKKNILIAAGVALALLGTSARSENLLEVYQAAVRSDPQIREAEARRMAALEAKPQARGVLFPQLSVNGNAYTASADTEGFQRQFREVTNPDTGEPSAVPVSVPYTNTTDTDSFWNYDAQVTQTLFRWDQWQRLKQADSQVALAEAEYRAAQQDLMVRVSQRYFDVLAAAETLRASEATLDAFTQQLAQAERRFKVGVVTVIDVEEARSARDAAAAGSIAAKRSLAVASELLTELTGELHPELERPADELPVSDAEQRGEPAWVEQAIEQNLAVVAARFGVDIAKRDVRIA